MLKKWKLNLVLKCFGSTFFFFFCWNINIFALFFYLKYLKTSCNIFFFFSVRELPLQNSGSQPVMPTADYRTSEWSSWLRYNWGSQFIKIWKTKKAKLCFSICGCSALSGDASPMCEKPISETYFSKWHWTFWGQKIKIGR